MPVSIEKRGDRWVIVETATGKVKGHSTTKGKAQKSANARNAALYGWKPTGKK